MIEIIEWIGVIVAMFTVVFILDSRNVRWSIYRCASLGEAKNAPHSQGGAAVESETMELCGNCDNPRFVHDAVLEKCPNCGDDEIDLAMRGDI